MQDARTNSMSNNTIWPEGKKFALCLTHDVDRVDKSWWHCAYYFAKTGRAYHLKSMFIKGKERPYWNFERIMALEEKHGVRSTFFFLNETKKLEILKFDTFKLAFGNYSMDSQKIVDIIKKLDEGGWEIGVHGSYDSYNNKELLAQEKRELERILERPVVGIRQHYLHLEIPETWKIQQEIGFKYDASFGYRDKVEFRDGKLLPFKPIGGDFVVIPLAIMDGPLFSSMDIEDAWLKCEKIINLAQKTEAILTVLWHSNRFNDDEFPGQMRIYERIIEESKKRNAWVATGAEIWNWCKNDS
jgi:peptidoglycan/xylan/chitin deacetylase (PgdA/CDA1 family)